MPQKKYSEDSGASESLINDTQTLTGAVTEYGTKIPIYDDSWGNLYIARDTLGIRGIVRAMTFEDAYSIVEDEFLPEADETMEELIAEYGFKRDHIKCIRRETPDGCRYKFAELADYPLDQNGWEFVSWVLKLELDQDAWYENDLFDEAYGFRPNGPNATDKINHGIYAKDLNGDFLEVLTPALAAELGITLTIESEDATEAITDATDGADDTDETTGGRL